MPRQSIATIDGPEFINITPYNPLISECEIKVFYLGENRNHSYISKEVAKEMANTLPGCPIVGYYRDNKEDFADHGDRVTFDSDGIHFECLTTPYGFVAPNAKVWFQKFEDTDEFGNSVIREYLMTTGYLWTGQFKEAQRVIDKGNPQSMELDEETLDGKWSQNLKTGLDFFIINDAIFSKLCILGEDVEPCFEGAAVSAPQVSTSFAKVDDGFKYTLYSMMQELKTALEGGQKMSLENNVDFSAEQDKNEKEVPVKNQISTEGQSSQDVTSDFVASKKDEKEDSSKDSKDEGKNPKEDTASKEPESKDDEEDNKKEYACGTDEDKKKDYALLETKYSELETKYSNLAKECEDLKNFKLQIENEKKDELIKSFYMLSDEDKKDVVENKTKYSLDEIEAKLSVICVRKRVNFDLDNSSKEEETIEENSVTTYSLEDQNSSIPAWISALKNTKNSRNN